MREFILRVSVLGWLPEDALVFLESHLKTWVELSPKEWRLKAGELMALVHEIVDENLRDKFKSILLESKEVSNYIRNHREELNNLLLEEFQNER